MPYYIKRNPRGRGWLIIRKRDNKVVGHSDTIAKAKASIGYRMRGEYKR